MLTDKNRISYVKPNVRVSLVSRCHRLAALSDLAERQTDSIWNNELLRMSLVTTLYMTFMSPLEIILYSRSCNKIARFIISDNPFLDMVKPLVLFANMFKLYYSVQFLDEMTDEIRGELPPSNFHPGCIISSWKLYIIVA